MEEVGFICEELSLQGHSEGGECSLPWSLWESVVLPCPRKAWPIAQAAEPEAAVSRQTHLPTWQHLDTWTWGQFPPFHELG